MVSPFKIHWKIEKNNAAYALFLPVIYAEAERWTDKHAGFQIQRWPPGSLLRRGHPQSSTVQTDCLCKMQNTWERVRYETNQNKDDKNEKYTARSLI
jgi:hypothetical protein